MNERRPQIGERVVFDEWVNGRFNKRCTGTILGEGHDVFKIQADNALSPLDNTAFFYLSASQFEVLTPLDEFTTEVFDERR